MVQKCLPHLGHSQNCCGGHGSPGPGSRRSICVPQRWHRMRISTSLMGKILALSGNIEPNAAGAETQLGWQRGSRSLLPRRSAAAAPESPARKPRWGWTGAPKLGSLCWSGTSEAASRGIAQARRLRSAYPTSYGVLPGQSLPNARKRRRAGPARSEEG